MMMISNMKSDKAKFNIEISEIKKFEKNPNFDRPDGMSRKGEKQIQQDAAAKIPSMSLFL